MAKWPNDVLLRKNGCKVCGNLIEVRNGTLLVGFGLNLDGCPTVCDGGRQAGAICDVICTDGFDRIKFMQCVQRYLCEYVTCLNRDLIMDEWKSWVDWNIPVFLRDNPGIPYKALGIDDDGFLVVQASNGNIKTLIDSYLI